MRKNLKLSLITGTLLASVSLFIGCGGGGGGSASTSGTDSVDTSTAKTTGPVVDGYLVKLRTPVYDDANHTSTDIVLDENNITTGKIRFNTPIKGNVIIPKDAIYDSNGNGKYDPGVDKSLGFPLMGEANYPITPASTYEVITHNPLPEDLKKDPIKELENGNPTLYLIEQSIIKAIKLANNNISILNDINISVEEINGTKIPKVKSDNNESLQKVFNIYNNPILLTATKVALKEGGLKPQELIKAAEINGTIAKKIYDVIDKNNLVEKVVKEAKNYGVEDIDEGSAIDSLGSIADAEQEVTDLVKEETQNVTTSGSTEKQDITTPSTSGSTKNSTNQEKVGSLKDNQPQQNVEQTPKDQIESNPSNNSNSSNLDNPPFPSMGSRYIWIGKDRVALDNGNFNTVNKNRSDDVEDIWNISFKIDNKNLDNFNIGVKILKESTGATGDIVFSGLSIKNGVINSPKKIDIYGIKSNGDEGGTHFDSRYNPDNILSKSISLDGDILTIKFGTVIKQQDVVSVNSFKAISRYKIQIDSDKLNIIGAKIFSNKESIHYTTGDSFNKKSEIMGYIKIN